MDFNTKWCVFVCTIGLRLGLNGYATKLERHDDAGVNTRWLMLNQDAKRVLSQDGQNFVVVCMINLWQTTTIKFPERSKTSARFKWSFSDNSMGSVTVRLIFWDRLFPMVDRLTLLEPFQILNFIAGQGDVLLVIDSSKSCCLVAGFRQVLPLYEITFVVLSFYLFYPEIPRQNRFFPARLRTSWCQYFKNDCSTLLSWCDKKGDCYKPLNIFDK